MPRHIVVLLLLLVGLATAGLFAKAHFTVASFYKYGHYRANSVPQIASQDPVLQTSHFCKKCHDDEYGAWSDGIHKPVQCEVCHGSAGNHPKPDRMVITTDPVRQCSQCHEAMPGRPKAIKQIHVAWHTGSQQCISCHNPHSPKPAVALEKVVGDVVAGKQAAAACTGCHGAAGISRDAKLPNLAGQNAPYLAKTLADHKPITKPDGSSVQVTQLLGDQGVKDVAVYFASLDCKQPVPPHNPAGDIEAGRNRAALCVACHGQGGRGSNPAWPKLAGQQFEYLVSQLNEIKAGSRPRRVSVMSDIAGGMNNADIANLAAYFSQSQCRLEAAGRKAP